MREPETKILTAHAYRIIKEKIIDLKLRPGELLVAQNLGTELGISRTPVREALVRLAQEGLVEPASGRKFRVSEITLQRILEIYEIRLAMESLAARSLAKRITPEGLERMRNCLAEAEGALKKGDHENFFKHDLEFHSILIELHGNETLRAFLQSMSDRMQQARHLTLSMAGRLENTIPEHGDLIKALEKRDAAAAERAVRRHLSVVVEQFKELMGSTDADGAFSAWIQRAVLSAVAMRNAGKAPRPSTQRRAI
jgi:DNA-binding GntR family transcriptional regulator